MSTDKNLLKERFAANFGKYDKLAHVQQAICREISLLLREKEIYPVKKGLEIGIGTGFLTHELIVHYPDAEWYLNDIAPAAEKYVDKFISDCNAHFLWGDAESIDFPHGLDLIATSSTVQWFNDLHKFVSKTYAATNRGGYLVLSSFGKDNFREIKSTTGEGLVYFSLGQIQDMIRKEGYKILYKEEKKRELWFENPSEVLRHIKATGVNSIKKVRWNKSDLAEFTAAYKCKFSGSDGKVSLTYHPLVIIAQKTK